MIVRVIGSKGKSSLIEWSEPGEANTRYRSFVRREDVEQVGDLFICENPHIGNSYGIPWAELFKDVFTTKSVSEVSDSVENELHRLNVWTYEEAKAKPQLVLAAIQTAFGINSRNLIGLAKDYLEKDHGIE